MPLVRDPDLGVKFSESDQRAAEPAVCEGSGDQVSEIGKKAMQE